MGEAPILRPMAVPLDLPAIAGGAPVRGEHRLDFAPPALGDEERANVLHSLETGWLTTGCVFDSSRDAGRSPFSFVIGATPPNVILGWEEGLLTMRVGGKRRLVIPPALAYGATGQGSIPGNATLIFDVELLSAA